MNPIADKLIAPCGINCAVCSRHLAYRNNLTHSQCIGCRPGNRKCTYLFAKCAGTNNTATGDRGFCYECEHYPCDHLNRVDARYRKNYPISIIENLEYINRFGLRQFIEKQYEKHHCSRCGGLISIHNRKCFACDKVTRLVEKHNKETGRE
jgi:hypothetical protein